MHVNIFLNTFIDMTLLYINHFSKTVFTVVVKRKCCLYPYCLYLQNEVATTYSENRTISKS